MLAKIQIKNNDDDKRVKKGKRVGIIALRIAMGM